MLSLKSVMTTDVHTVKPDTLVFDAMQMLMKYKISGLPVVDEDMNLKGILTEKDVLRILVDKDAQYKRLVGDFMTKDVVTFSEEDSVIKVCQFFIKSHIRRVPIVQNGKLIGIVSRRDIMRIILEAKDTLSSSRFT